MGISTSHVNTYSRYIGRVGALAATLGIGVMVATSPGLASADTSTSSSTSTDASQASASTAGAANDGTDDARGATSSRADVAPRVTVGSSGASDRESTEPKSTTTPDNASSSEGADEVDEEQHDESAPSTKPAPTDSPAEPDSDNTDTDTDTDETVSEREAARDGSNHRSSKPPSSVSTTRHVNGSDEETSESAVDTDELASAREVEATQTRISVDPEPGTVTTETVQSTRQTTVQSAAVATQSLPNAAPATQTEPLAIVSNFVAALAPLVAPTPTTPAQTPLIWGVLAWVRRNFFNESPIINYNPAQTVQTGQVITGRIGATDAEGDRLTYTIKKQPRYGTLTIDQATGNFTYTPSDINYTAAQTDSFTVSVTDGKFNLLSFGRPHSDQKVIGLTVLTPTVERAIVQLPASLQKAQHPRFTADGKALYFNAAPVAGGRAEIYQIDVDGTNFKCLTCGVSTNITGDLSEAYQFQDGSGRYLMQVSQSGSSSRSFAILELNNPNGAQLVPVAIPAGTGTPIDAQREMRIAPDGVHVGFSQIRLGANNYAGIVPIVGKLNRTDTEYQITDARVVHPTGELREFTPDGKGVIIFGGLYEAGNADDIRVDLATGTVTRVTANLDYDEVIEYSPNGRWVAVGSMRTQNALTPMSQIVRPHFLPSYIIGPVYNANATRSNEPWVIAADDELNRENGLRLFDPNDEYTSRSTPNWNATGDAVTFWESKGLDRETTETRLVVARLQYTASVGAAPADRTTPDPSWAPLHSAYQVAPPQLPGSRAGKVSGTATVTETQQPWCSTASCQSPSDPVLTVRTVTYKNFADEAGLVLNGTETTLTNANLTYIHYLADIEVSGKHTGFLQADATVKNRQNLTGYIVSRLDDGPLLGIRPVKPANVAVDFGADQGALLHTERYNNFHVSTTFDAQRPEDVEYLNSIGLHGAMYRAWLNSPNQTEPTCTGSSGACELSPSMKAYLKDLGNVSDAQIANFRLTEWVGKDSATAQAGMERIVLAVKQAQPEIVYIEAWNEPDAPGGGVDGGVTPAQVYEGYQALYRAVNNVNATLAAQDPNYVPLKVGGPAMYYFNTTLLNDFLDRYAADPDPNKRLDFISYHAYVNILPNGARQFYKENPSWVKDYRNQLDAMLAARGLPTNTPAFVTETGIYPGPLCDMCDSTDYARQAAGMVSLHYWLGQQHDTYVFNWVARRQGLKDQFVTQNAVGPHLDFTNPRNPSVLWQPYETLPSDALTPYGNVMLMQSMMEDVRVAAATDQLDNGVGVYAVAAKDPVLPEASVMVWNYAGCSGTPGTTSCGSTSYDTTIDMSGLPNGLGDGPVTVTVYRVDQHTSNYWADPLNTDPSTAQLEQVDQRTVTPVNGGINYQADLLPNSVYLFVLRVGQTQTAA
jgi:VCBS repeat-containing protein